MPGIAHCSFQSETKIKGSSVFYFFSPQCMSSCITYVLHLFLFPSIHMVRSSPIFVLSPFMIGTQVFVFYNFKFGLLNDYYKTNVMGTLNMLGLAKRIGSRFLLTSTSEVYGDPLEHPQKESYWGHVNPIGTSPSHFL
jgi:hypothetical protein